MASKGLGANFFLSYLASSLSLGGSETTIYLSTLTTLNGYTITSADAATFGRMTVTIDPLSQTNLESATFTGVDGVNIALTGCVRNLMPNGNDILSSSAPYHPVGTLVIISYGVHNISDMKDYIATVLAGGSGTATDLVAGSNKMTTAMGTLPRAVSATVSQQAVPNMTLLVNPFNISVDSGDVSYVGGSTATLVAPVSNPRIDLVVYNVAAAAIAVRKGTEGASPTVPLRTNGDIVLCSIFHRVGETVLKERDDTINGYIKAWYQVQYSEWQSGDYKWSARALSSTGWYPTDGSAKNRIVDVDLFTVIGTTYGAGDGSTTFNLPLWNGRSLVAAGTGTKVATIASIAGNIFTVTGLTNANNNEFQTGQPIVAGTTSGNIVASTTYYIIRVSNTTFSIATSLANAQANIVKTLAGTETGTFTLTLTTRTLGDTGGEEFHSQSGTELATHVVTIPSGVSGGASGTVVHNNASTDTATSNPVGSSTPANIMQPFGVANLYIKR